MTCICRMSVVVLLPLLLTAFAAAQPTGLASIAGRAATADGRGLRALVALQPAPFKGASARDLSVRRAPTDRNGAFQFQGLPAGKYSLCAQPLPMQGRNPNELFADACEWGLLQAVQLAAGQVMAGLELRIPAGTPIRVNVNDPEGVLTPPGRAVSQTNPSFAGTQLMVFLKDQSSFIHPVPITAHAAGRREHSMVAPQGLSLGLSVRSAQLGVFDAAGKALSGEIPVRAVGEGNAGQVTVTVRGGRP